MEICTKQDRSSSVLGARTNCTHYNHKEHEPGKTAAVLESGTGNQIGEVIRKNAIHCGEKIKGTYCTYSGKVGYKMEGKIFDFKENNREVMRGSIYI